MMDGRVKTLHPKIHGGLLGRRGTDDEVMASQENMKKKKGKIRGSESSAFNVKLSAAYKKFAREVNQFEGDNANVEMLRISYRDMVENCGPEIDKITAFLGQELDKEQMASIVDKKLYRERAENQSA